MQNVARVLDVIRATRPMLLPHWGNIQESSKKDGLAHSVVTELDLKVETFLRDSLAAIEPGVQFAGEEFGGRRDVERFWLCDPIDGTAHFIRGLPFCTVMLAFIENGIVNFSAIYDFINDSMYYATRGEGACMNAGSIHVSSRDLAQAYIAFETRIDKPVNYEKTRRLRERSVIFSSITAGYEFTLVATGKLEARVCLDPWGKDWDYAPGTLLVSEAGGIVTNIGSSTYEFSNLNFIAANPHVYRALTEGPDAIFPAGDQT